MKTFTTHRWTRLGAASRAAWACLGVNSRRSRVLLALIVGLGLIPARWITAQTFTTLHSFTDVSDGANPSAGLISSGNTLFGTAMGGGSSDAGTIFAVNTDGGGFTNLHDFTRSSTNASGALTNSDGAEPVAGLILSGDTLYGTASYGGSSGCGTVFAVNTNGTGFTNLYSFTATSHTYPPTNSDGALPHGGLILSGGTLYGTAGHGGSSGHGTLFAVSTDGTGFTNLHNFSAISPFPDYTNYDGAEPVAGLILSRDTLYGAASYGGNWGNGTVFAVNTNGTGFTNLHSFTAVPFQTPYTNGDGADPQAGLVLSGSTLYGTAVAGGNWGNGTVFKLNTDGSAFTNLHSFTATSGPPSTNSDGAYPYAGLTTSGGDTLYGTARLGGPSGYGTVFSINTNGTGFTGLYFFTVPDPVTNTNRDGGSPTDALSLSGNVLYGTADVGGSSGSGTLFSLSFAPKLTITPSGTNVILTWPTNVAGFDYIGFALQSTTNLLSPAVWTAVLPTPVVADGQNAVTDPVSGAKRFYRLSQ
ncbi:conserved hypothetical protein [Verrucomicrobia bacterium]|nr:conserved hypothetical protein [Verrucomicrobiota bacterium]